MKTLRIRRQSTGTDKPEYRVWANMKQRCLNPNCHAYDRYGGRGIRVCERWTVSFDSFLSDMGPRPSNNHQLERRDNDGHYEPNNCYWATTEEQGFNKSKTRHITANGETRTLSQWAKQLGTTPGVIRNRIKSGWPTEHAVTAPVRRFWGQS